MPKLVVSLEVSGDNKTDGAAFPVSEVPRARIVEAGVDGACWWLQLVEVLHCDFQASSSILS